MARTTFTAVNSQAGSKIALDQAQTLSLATIVDDTGPATATAVATGTADATGLAAATGLKLMGFSVRESASSAAVATLYLRNGTASSDPIIALIELAANESKVVWFGVQGVACAGGIWVDRVAGESEIVLYTKTSS